MSFIKAVQEKKIAPPNKREFSLENWKRGYDEYSVSENEDDSMFYYAGIVFDKLLFGTVRKHLHELHSFIPESKNEDLIKRLCAISNFNLISINETILANNIDNANVDVPLKFKNAFGDFESSPQDLVETAIDSLVFFLKNRLRDLSKKNKSEEPIDIFIFLKYELILSEIYYAIEYYWQGVLWGSYEVKRDNKIIIKEKNSDENINYLLSRNRVMKLDEQVRLLTGDLEVGETVLIFENGNVNTKKTSELSEEYCIYFKNTTYRALLALDRFPSSLIQENIPNYNFGIVDIIQVFNLLSLLVSSAFKHIKAKDVDTIEELLEYLPVFDSINLYRSLVNATGFDLATIKQIIDLLSFTPKQNNLWSYPIIQLQDNNLILLGSMLSPNCNRNIEYWLRDFFSKKIEKKGYKFEDDLVKTMDDVFCKSSFFTQHNQPHSQEFRFGEDKEQIDCIFSFGKNIVICEAKCIFSSDSEISKHNTRKELKKGAKQAKRKAEFVRRHLKEISKILNWSFDSSLQYEFIPVVINSNGLYVGHNFEGVPVVDKIILEKYFLTNTFPLISESLDNHIAWFELYSDQSEAEENFSLYIENPPQLFLDKSSVRYVRKPFIGKVLGYSFDIEIENLVIEHYTIQDIFSKKYPFPLKTVDKADEIINSAQIIM